MRLFCDGVIKDTASLGSPGMDEMRWIKPVRPGDTLSLRMTVTDCVPSRSKPDRGIIRSLLELSNVRAFKNPRCGPAPMRATAALTRQCGRIDGVAMPHMGRECSTLTLLLARAEPPPHNFLGQVA